MVRVNAMDLGKYVRDATKKVCMRPEVLKIFKYISACNGWCWNKGTSEILNVNVKPDFLRWESSSILGI